MRRKWQKLSLKLKPGGSFLETLSLIFQLLLKIDHSLNISVIVSNDQEEMQICRSISLLKVLEL